MKHERGGGSRPSFTTLSHSVHSPPLLQHRSSKNLQMVPLTLLHLRPSALLLPPSLPRFPSLSIHGSLPRDGRHPRHLFPPFLQPNRAQPLIIRSRKGTAFICSSDGKEKLKTAATRKESGQDWPILERWDVPWQWQTVSLTMIACGVSFILTGLIGASFLEYLGFHGEDTSIDEKAEILFAGQFSATVVVLGVIYGIINTFQPLPDDVFRYDLKEPFNLRDGWLLWAGIGLTGALIAVAITGAVMAIYNGENPERETDALVRLLPLIGSSGTSTALLVGITGVLAPLLEETLFRGFLMVSLTQWLPTPVSVVISAALFAVAHFTPGQIPQLFVLGCALGLSYAQTRNLLTPITIHAVWNSGVILLLTFLQLQGYDIRDIIQAS